MQSSHTPQLLERHRAVEIRLNMTTNLVHIATSLVQRSAPRSGFRAAALAGTKPRSPRLRRRAEKPHVAPQRPPAPATGAAKHACRRHRIEKRSRRIAAEYLSPCCLGVDRRGWVGTAAGGVCELR